MNRFQDLALQWWLTVLLKHYGCRYLAVLILGQLWWMLPAAAADLSNPQPADEDVILPMPNDVSMVFRPVFIGEGGAAFAAKKFTVGDPEVGFKEYPTNVIIGGAFKTPRHGQPQWLYYIGKYEVTEAQYAAIMDPQNRAARDSQLPIRNISWFDAQQFIHKYNLWLFEHARDKLPRNEGPNPNEHTIGFLRLPTEMEWEFAARGGAEVNAVQFGKKHPYTEADLRQYEWYSGPESSHDKLQKIGLLKPNVLKIHDMLGNVSEMTASLYQIEYYQGRIGGFVTRGGNYTTNKKNMRSSLRTEQPFYGRDYKPQASQTLGLRLVISTIIIAGKPDLERLRSRLEGLPGQPRRDASPAAVSVAPPATQTIVQLAEAEAMVDSLIGDASLSPDHRRQLELVKASFGHLQAQRKQEEAESARNHLESATNRGLFIYRAFEQMPTLLKAIEVAGSSGNSAIKDKVQQRYDDHLKEIDAKMRDYADSIRRLNEHPKDSIEGALQTYKTELVASGDADRLNILVKAVTKHLGQFMQQRKADLDQWKTDLKKF